MSNENSSNPMWLVFIQPYYAASQGQDPDAMEDAKRKYGSKGNIIQNTYEMVGWAISMSVHYKQLISGISLVGHGSNFSLRIGLDVVTVNSLTPGHEFYKPHVYLPLMQLAPYLHPSAKIEIQQCKCSNSDEGKDLLKKMSQVLKRPVIGFSGEITFGRGVEYEEGGRFTVCVSEFCFTPPH